MDERRPLCAEVSRESAEPLAATASRIETGSSSSTAGSGAATSSPGRVFGPGEGLPARAARPRPRSRLLFIRRRSAAQHPSTRSAWAPDRRARQHHARSRARRLQRPARSGPRRRARHRPRRVGAPVEGPLLVVCTHGKRDHCCAKFGRPLYDAQSASRPRRTRSGRPHTSAATGSPGTWSSLPEGLYFGRVERSGGLGASGRGARRPHPPRRTTGGARCYSFAEQAAERAVREATGATAPADLALVSSEAEADGWLVRFEASGEVHEVVVTTGARRAHLPDLRRG